MIYIIIKRALISSKLQVFVDRLYSPDTEYLLAH